MRYRSIYLPARLPASSFRCVVLLIIKKTSANFVSRRCDYFSAGQGEAW